jgi:hypothetical protein
MFLARCLVAVAILAVPSLASADAPKEPSHSAKARAHKGKPTRTAHVDKGESQSEPRACMKPAIEVAAGSETGTFSLAKCDGSPASVAVDELSILARPGSAAKPKQPVEGLPKSKGPDVAPGIRRIDARLVERLQLAVEHFRKASETVKVQLVSGVRPKSAGSYHQSGRALDFRIDGVTNEALVAFCKTLPDTGCGYYPNSLFVHMDARDKGAGHVAWIDISKPGETPKYVKEWPLPNADVASPPTAKEDSATPAAMMALPVLPAEDQGEGSASSARKRKSGKAFFF